MFFFFNFSFNCWVLLCFAFSFVAVCLVHSFSVFGSWIRAIIAVSASSMAGLVCSKSGMEQVLVENEVQQVKLLDSVNDDHGGVIVELSEAMDLKVFASMLKASIALWRSQVFIGVLSILLVFVEVGFLLINVLASVCCYCFGIWSCLGFVSSLFWLFIKNYKINPPYSSSVRCT